MAILFSPPFRYGVYDNVANQIKSNQIKSSLFSHTYNKQYVHFIKSDVTEEIL